MEGSDPIKSEPNVIGSDDGSDALKKKKKKRFSLTSSLEMKTTTLVVEQAGFRPVFSTGDLPSLSSPISPSPSHPQQQKQSRRVSFPPSSTVANVAAASHQRPLPQRTVWKSSDAPTDVGASSASSVVCEGEWTLVQGCGVWGRGAVCKVWKSGRVTVEEGGKKWELKRGVRTGGGQVAMMIEKEDVVIGCEVGHKLVAVEMPSDN